MPFRAELATAADVGDDEDAALLHPRRADQSVVARRERHLEPAVSVQQGRGCTVELQALPRHLEVGNLRAVLRRGLVLADGEPLGIEERRGLLERLWRPLADRAQRERDRRDVVIDRQEVVVRLVRIDCGDIGVAKLRQAGEFLSRPASGCPGQETETAVDVVELVQDDVVARRRERGEGGSLGRLEEHVELRWPSRKASKLAASSAPAG